MDPILTTILIPLLLIFLFWKKSKTRLNIEKNDKGDRTERQLKLMLLKAGFPSQTIFHNLYVKKANGSYSQIDLAVVTQVGIIVFEVKNYSGWIFGDGRYTKWTKVMAYGKEKYRFYNPIKQNDKHISELKKQSRQFRNIPFFSVVVFFGNSVLKDISFVPEGTYIVKPHRVIEMMNLILQNNEPAPYTDKHEVLDVLSKAVRNGENREIKSQHIENIKDMLGEHRVFD